MVSTHNDSSPYKQATNSTSTCLIFRLYALSRERIGNFSTFVTASVCCSKSWRLWLSYTISRTTVCRCALHSLDSWYDKVVLKCYDVQILANRFGFLNNCTSNFRP